MRTRKTKKSTLVEQKFKAYWDLRLCYPYNIYILDDGIQIMNREYKPLVYTADSSETYSVRDMQQLKDDLTLALEPEERNRFFFYDDHTAPYYNDVPDAFDIYKEKLRRVRQVLQKQGIDIVLSFPYVIDYSPITREKICKKALTSEFLISEWLKNYVFRYSTDASIRKTLLKLRNIIPADDFEQFLKGHKRYYQLLYKVE